MTTRVVLVGLPGAGKSAVARVLAARLGWRCADIDDEIVRQTGRTVAEIFATDGEAAFRAMEARLTEALSSLPQLVLAPGAGWAAQPGHLDGLPAGTAVIWLRVSLDEALRRLGGSPERRPLLTGSDPAAALQILAEQRTPHYERADFVIDVDGRSVDDIAWTISEWLERSTS